MHPRVRELAAFLDDSHRDLLDTVNRIPIERRHKRPPDGGWSIAEIVEHLAIVEARMTGSFAAWVAEAQASGLAAETDEGSILDRFDVAPFIDRGRRRVASAASRPTGTMPVEAALIAFSGAHMRRHASQIRDVNAALEACAAEAAS
jgi:hypothetical protein